MTQHITISHTFNYLLLLIASSVNVSLGTLISLFQQMSLYVENFPISQCVAPPVPTPNVGAIIGGVFAAVVALCIIVAAAVSLCILVWWCSRRRTQASKHTDNHSDYKKFPDH